MIRCHLARMMGEHKMRIADVARETGLSRATVTLLRAICVITQTMRNRA